jgi:hypothetical protein
MMLLPARALPGQVAIELEKMNVVYAGVDNPLTVVVQDSIFTPVRIRPSIGEIRQQSPRKFTWSICSFDSSHAELLVEDSLRGAVLATRHFRVKGFGAPGQVAFHYIKPRIRARSDDDPDDLPDKWVAGIGVVTPDFHFEVRCETMQYVVEITYRTGPTTVMKGGGRRFSDEIVTQLRKMKSGDTVRISEIKYRCGCNERTYRAREEVIYTVK